MGAGVGLVYDERMCAHANVDDPFHPETPARIKSIYDSLKSAGIVERCQVVEARDATTEELASVHTEDHIARMRAVSSEISGKAKRKALAHRYNSIYFNEGSSKSALLAAGSVVELSVRVARGDLRAGAALVRPPGHHAEAGAAMGFCLFNNVAVAAHVLVHGKTDLGINKLLIVDWDVHHGNGTQHMFWKDPQVLYFSIHRHDFGYFYPGGEDGNYDRVGEDEGAGFNINVPWPHEGFGDLDYLTVFDHLLMPIAHEFKPDMVLVSGGFDSATGDPLGECEVTPAGYSQMTHRLMSLASGRVVLALEGGYNLKSISESYLACMKVMLGDTPEKITSTIHHVSTTYSLLQEIRNELEQHWLALSTADGVGIMNNFNVEAISAIDLGKETAYGVQVPKIDDTVLGSSSIDLVDPGSSLSEERQKSELDLLLETFSDALTLSRENRQDTDGGSNDFLSPCEIDSSRDKQNENVAMRSEVILEQTANQGERQMTATTNVGLSDSSKAVVVPDVGLGVPVDASKPVIMSEPGQKNVKSVQNVTDLTLKSAQTIPPSKAYGNHSQNDGVYQDGDSLEGSSTVVSVLSSLGYPPDHGNPNNNYVWYGCYGSNLWSARFMCYIKGGQVDGMAKRCIGARNQAPPIASRWVKVPHSLFFGHSWTDTWGSGGVAFLDPVAHEGAPTTHMRLYKITLQQLSDVLAQENREDPEKWDCVKELQNSLSRMHSTINFLEDTWYGTVKYLGDEEGLPVLTITCSEAEVQKFREGKLVMCPPSESYRNVILKGLLEHDLSEEESIAYLDSKSRGILGT